MHGLHSPDVDQLYLQLILTVNDILSSGKYLLNLSKFHKFELQFQCSKHINLIGTLNVHLSTSIVYRCEYVAMVLLVYIFCWCQPVYQPSKQLCSKCEFEFEYLCIRSDDLVAFAGEVDSSSLHVDWLLTGVSFMSRVDQRSPLARVCVLVCIWVCGVVACTCAQAGGGLHSGRMWNWMRKISDRWWDCASDPVYVGVLCSEGREERGGGGTYVFGRPCAEHMFVLTVEIPRISLNKPVNRVAGLARLNSLHN